MKSRQHSTICYNHVLWVMGFATGFAPWAGLGRVFSLDLKKPTPWDPIPQPICDYPALAGVISPQRKWDSLAKLHLVSTLSIGPVGEPSLSLTLLQLDDSISLTNQPLYTH